MDDWIHSLWKNDIISDDMFQMLREVELFDSRESEIIMDLSRAEHLFSKFHDFSIWYYKKYVDDSLAPTIFIQPAKPEINNKPIPHETDNKPPSPYVHIDEILHQADWEKSLELLSNYTIMSYDDGERYEGQIIKGLRHGQGRHTWHDGTVYIGDWRHELEHGYGEKLFANGDVYRGYWKNGTFDAQGTYIWKDGQMYEGQWQDGFEHGFGTQTTQDGVKNTGYWTYGEFVHSAQQLKGRN